MSARYVGIFHVLLGLVAVGDEVGEVALQVVPMDGESAGDAVEMLQQEFGHSDALGEDAEQVAAVDAATPKKIAACPDGTAHGGVHIGVELLPGFEEVGKAFRSCERALHRLYSSMVLVFLSRYFYKN